MRTLAHVDCILQWKALLKEYPGKVIGGPLFERMLQPFLTAVAPVVRSAYQLHMLLYNMSTPFPDGVIPLSTT